MSGLSLYPAGFEPFGAQTVFVTNNYMFGYGPTLVFTNSFAVPVEVSFSGEFMGFSLSAKGDFILRYGKVPLQLHPQVLQQYENIKLQSGFGV